MTGVEARGFIFGPSIALAIGAKFIPLRKPRKLPGTFTFHKHIQIKNILEHSRYTFCDFMFVYIDFIFILLLSLFHLVKFEKRRCVALGWNYTTLVYYNICTMYGFARFVDGH